MPLPETILSDLRRVVGTENVLTSQEDLIPYSFDGTAALQQMPGCVIFAPSGAEVGAVLKLASASRIPVVTRGSGTGLSGGSLPSRDCIVLCTVKLNRILEVDRANLTLMAEPGVTTLAIADAAAAVGLFYPPDPGSMKISTIGGNVAENSGGLRGLKYGITRNYVMGLEVVLPDGEILWTGNKCVKDVAGYSLKRPLHRLAKARSACHYESPAPPDPQTRREEDDGRHLQCGWIRPPQIRLGHHRRADHSRARWSSSTAPRFIASRIIAKVGLPLDCEALAAHGNRRPPRRRRPRKPRKMERDLPRRNGCDGGARRQGRRRGGNKLATARRSAFSALARRRAHNHPRGRHRAAQ